MRIEVAIFYWLILLCNLRLKLVELQIVPKRLRKKLSNNGERITVLFTVFSANSRQDFVFTPDNIQVGENISIFLSIFLSFFSILP